METLKSLTGPLVLARTRAPDLESVRKLNCWGSEIEDISVVRQMPNLEVCSVSVNEITTLQDFEDCVNLQELYIPVEPEEIEEANEKGEELSLPDTEVKPESPAPDQEKLTNGEAGGAEGGDTPNNPPNQKDPLSVTLDETNKIREQFGLKPLPIQKIGSPKSAPTSSTRARNSHILQAMLILMKELDRDTLEILDTAIRKRLESL
ncbi:CF410-like protein [Mya arenaria]|uniref:CF410-like protein n=1 Tax=Mya arenaria TaxID=6604 RepID=A0ABY7E721_MYAAR|nr:CF410-like protein [Mya arenaria]